MSRRRAFLILLLFVPTSALAAESADARQLLGTAEADFARGVALKADPDQARKSFLAAAQSYHQLYQQGCHNADLCRDWGQAEFLADRLPHAVLAWRLGLLLAPTDPALRANLEYARDQVEYPPGNAGRPTPRPWPAWLPWPGAAARVVLVLCAYALVWLLGTVWLIRRQTGWLVLTGFGVLALAAMLGGHVVLEMERRDHDLHPIVVIATEHTLRRGNGNSYPAHDKIPIARPGMEARLLFRRGDWLQLEFAGGHVGWVPQSAALVADQR